MLVRFSRHGIAQAISSELGLIAGIDTTLILFTVGESWLVDLTNIPWLAAMFVCLFAVMIWCAFGVVDHAALLSAGILTGALMAGSFSQAASEEAGGQEREVFAHALTNAPGKTLIAVVVTYAPGGQSGEHHHAGSVFAYVLSGAIRSEYSATGPARVYKAGESFFEPLVASTSSARTRSRPSRQACLPSSSPMTGQRSPPSTREGLAAEL